MERIEYRGVIDKASWARGAWDSEPDKIQWQDEATGHPCLVVRGPSGALCGYVGVDESHTLYGKGYDDAPVEVHGGLTFAAGCSPNGDEARHICHKPSPGEADHVWWFGFDCAHAGDFCPKFDRPEKLGRETGWGTKEEYRAIEYVQAECRALAKQLAEIRR